MCVASVVTFAVDREEVVKTNTGLCDLILEVGVDSDRCEIDV